MPGMFVGVEARVFKSLGFCNDRGNGLSSRLKRQEQGAAEPFNQTFADSSQASVEPKYPTSTSLHLTWPYLPFSV